MAGKVSRKFRLHFNRVNMQRKSPNVWSVHWANQSFQVAGVVCRVPVETVFQPAGEPKAYLSGQGIVTVRKGTAYIEKSAARASGKGE